MKTEQTLVIIKPDVLGTPCVDDIIQRVCNHGQVVKSIYGRLTTSLIQQHYAHIIHESYYHEVENFMMSGPVYILQIRGESIVSKVRELVGPTDSTKAPKGTIRGDYGVDVMRNAIHASDSVDSANREIKLFFSY